MTQSMIEPASTVSLEHLDILVLRYVAASHGTSLDEMQANMRVDIASLGPVVDRLREQGLVDNFKTDENVIKKGKEPTADEIAFAHAMRQKVYTTSAGTKLAFSPQSLGYSLPPGQEFSRMEPEDILYLFRYGPKMDVTTWTYVPVDGQGESRVAAANERVTKAARDTAVNLRWQYINERGLNPADVEWDIRVTVQAEKTFAVRNLYPTLHEALERGVNVVEGVAAKSPYCKALAVRATHPHDGSGEGLYRFTVLPLPEKVFLSAHTTQIDAVRAMREFVQDIKQAYEALR